MTNPLQVLISSGYLPSFPSSVLLTMGSPQLQVPTHCCSTDTRGWDITFPETALGGVIPKFPEGQGRTALVVNNQM